MPDDKTIWYISGIVWKTYFSNPYAFLFSPDKCVRVPVNYRAFVRGDEKYIFNKDKELAAPEDFDSTTIQFSDAMSRKVLGRLLFNKDGA